jgi:hypothetical protein
MCTAPLPRPPPPPPHTHTPIPPAPLHLPWPQVDLQRLSSQAAALQAKIQASQERQAAAERARQGDRAYLQVGVGVCMGAGLRRRSHMGWGLRPPVSRGGVIQLHGCGPSAAALLMSERAAVSCTCGLMRGQRRQCSCVCPTMVYS